MARDQLIRRISTLQVEAISYFEPISLQGNEHRIIKDVVIPQTPVRLVIVGQVNVTLTRLNYENKSFRNDSTMPFSTAITEAGKYSIEISPIFGDLTDWTITIEPLLEGGFIRHTGNGDCVTDIFTLPQNSKIRFNVKSNDSYWRKAKIYLYFFNETMGFWDKVTILERDMVDGNEFEIDRQIDQLDDELKEGAKCFFKIEAGYNVDWGIFPLI